MDSLSGRRLALKTAGLVGIAAGLAALPDGGAKAADASLLPQGAKSLTDLAARLSRAEPGSGGAALELGRVARGLLLPRCRRHSFGNSNSS